MELWKYEGKNIKVYCIEDIVVLGRCINYTQALDNEPEIPSITLRNNLNGLTEIMENEIIKIEIIN